MKQDYCIIGRIFWAFVIQIAFIVLMGAMFSGCAYVPDNLDDVIDRELDKVDKPDQPLPEPDKPVAADQDEAAHGFTHKAVITHAIKYVKSNEGNVYYSGFSKEWPREDGTPIQNANDCNGEAHLFVNRNGKWIGGKFDHKRANGTQRDFINIHGGYGCFKDIGEPKPGETVAFMLISYKHDKRTNAIFFTWK